MNRLAAETSPYLLPRRWRNLVLVHLPLHASWLNQIEIVSSIIQRKLLQPNDFDDLALLARTLNEFEHHYNEVTEPFDWRANPGLYAAQKAARPELRRDRSEPAAEPGPEPARSRGRIPKVLTW
jgi:hypothetical protein